MPLKEKEEKEKERTLQNEDAKANVGRPLGCSSLLHPPTLRCCLLSGGASRRMGRDKALLPHPEGGTWLQRSLGLLAELGAPITLFSRHPAHLALAAGLPQVLPIAEAAPWEGPLLALHRLMQLHPEQRLLLCPVDMPDLDLAALRQLLAVAAQEPQGLHLAHDGRRLQPLLGIYPSASPLRQHLSASIASGERRLQNWLSAHPFQAVALDPRALRNVNRPDVARPDFNCPDFNCPECNQPSA